MAHRETLADLAGYKASLIAQADVRRAEIDLEVAHLRQPLEWAGNARQKLADWRPLLIVAAPLAGFILTRKWRGIARWAARGFMLFRALQRAGLFRH